LQTEKQISTRQNHIADGPRKLRSGQIENNIRINLADKKEADLFRVKPVYQSISS
jgi:hypothetical protein